MSTYASGTLGSELQFTAGRSCFFAGRRRRPKQPRTIPQRAPRLFMAAIAAAWQVLTPAQRATWSLAANARSLSPYHAYLQHNANRYKNLPGTRYGHATEPYYPTAAYPATLATEWAWNSDNVVTGLAGACLHQFHVYTPKDNWLYFWHRTTDDFAKPTFTNLVAAAIIIGAGTRVVRIENLPPGTQTLSLVRVSATGLTSDQSWNFYADVL